MACCFTGTEGMNWVVVEKTADGFTLEYHWCKTEQEGERMVKETKERCKQYINTRIEDYEITLHPWERGW